MVDSWLKTIGHSRDKRLGLALLLLATLCLQMPGQNTLCMDSQRLEPCRMACRLMASHLPGHTARFSSHMCHSKYTAFHSTVTLKVRKYQANILKHNLMGRPCLHKGSLMAITTLPLAT